MFQVEEIKSLNDLEMEVYRFIIQNRNKIKYMKIRELAEESHVSTSTVLRFCRKMGCDGYSEFKLEWKKYLDGKKETMFQDDVSEVIDYLKKSSSDEFEQTLEMVTDLLLQAPRIIFLGSGMSGIVANYGARYFSSMGKFCLSIDEPHYPTDSPFFEHAFVIVCSVSGESHDTIGHVTRFKKEYCKILSITNTSNSTLAKMSDYHIPYYVTYTKIKNYDVTTQIPAISIIERLGRKLYKKMVFREERE